MITQKNKRLLIFCPTEFLTDYFVYVAAKIHESGICKTTLASPFAIKNATLETKQITSGELCTQPHELVWTTSDQLKHVNPTARKIASNHHAGYGECFFVPNTNVTQYADFLFCAMYKPGNVPQSVFQQLLPNSPKRSLTVVPVGYPKLDMCINACIKSTQLDSVMITMASIADIPFDVEPVLNKTVKNLLSSTDYSVFVRPKPRDIDAPYVKRLENAFSSSGRFHINKDSYIPVLSRSEHMVFFGRHDVTTAYTSAYSTQRPVIFIDSNAEIDLAERDIGVTINSPDMLKQAMQHVTSASVKKRLQHNRDKDTDYPLQSAERIVSTIAWILNPDSHTFSNYHCYPIGPSETFQQTNIDALNHATNLSESVSKNHANPYVVENYLYHYLEHSNSQEQFSLIAEYLINHTKKLKTINYINVWTRLLNRAERKGIALDKEDLSTVSKIGRKLFSALPSPSEKLTARVFRCSEKSGDLNYCAILVNTLKKSKDRQTQAIILPYLRKHEPDAYSSLLEKYICTSGYWDVEKITLLTAKPYSLFGLGESSIQLVDYLKLKNMSLPRHIYGESPGFNLLNGCQVKDISTYCQSETLAIVSPTAHDNIQIRLNNMTPDTFKFFSIVTTD